MPKIYTDYLIQEGVHAAQHYIVYERPCVKCGKRVLIDKDYYDRLKQENKLSEALCIEHSK